MYDRQVGRLTSEQRGGVKMRRSASSTETWHKVVMVADWGSYNYLCLVSNAWVVFSGALYSVYTPAMACAPSHFWLNCGEVLQCMRNYSGGVCVFHKCVLVCLLVSQSFSEVVWIPECIFAIWYVKLCWVRLLVFGPWSPTQQKLHNSDKHHRYCFALKPLLTQL